MMIVAPDDAVITQTAQFVGQTVIIRYDETAVTETTQRLAGVKAETAGQAEGSDLPASPFGPERLGRILDNREPVAVGGFR